MTQHDAKTAVKHIQHKAKALQSAAQRETTTRLMLSISLGSLVEDIDDLLRQLDDRKQAAPNCRPATREELEQLCKGGNVVMFPAAA